MPALDEGAIFADKYRVVRRIGRGGMGAVYEVVHLETSRRRALKVMHADIVDNDELRARFAFESRVAADVRSDHVVDVIDAGVDAATSRPYIVMELLHGEDLRARLRRKGTLPPAEVVTFLHQAALALDRTHAASIVHRDLKPENLFLSAADDGRPRIKILDFGVAKLLSGTVTSGSTQAVGTPLYMAPEIFLAGGRVTGAVDVYALGMVAFTLLAGRPYWSVEAGKGNLFAVGAVVVLGPQEAARARAASWGVTLPAGFDAWFERIAAVDPGERFRTATEAVRALAGVLGVAVDAPIVADLPPEAAAPPPDASIATGTPERLDAAASVAPPRPAARIPRWILAVLALNTAALIAVAALALGHRDSPAPVVVPGTALPPIAAPPEPPTVTPSASASASAAPPEPETAVTTTTSAKPAPPPAARPPRRPRYTRE